MIVLVSRTGGGFGEIVAVELERVGSRSNIKRGGVITTDVFGLGKGSRIDKSNVSALIEEIST